MRMHTPQLGVGTFSPIASIDEVEGRKPFIEATNEQTKILLVVQYLGIGQGSCLPESSYGGKDTNNGFRIRLDVREIFMEIVPNSGSEEFYCFLAVSFNVLHQNSKKLPDMSQYDLGITRFLQSDIG